MVTVGEETADLQGHSLSWAVFILEILGQMKAILKEEEVGQGKCCCVESPPGRLDFDVILCYLCP